MIRPAIPGDVNEVIPLILQAIEDIAFVLSGTADVDKTTKILSEFFKQSGNRLSYEQTLVMEENGELVGMAIVYDGAEAAALNFPVEQAAVKKSGKPDYKIPIEPEVSEFYLDAVGVLPRCQGRGYGSALVEAGCNRARRQGHKRFALLVDLENPPAKRLYDRLGFRVDGAKWLAGKEYYHMVREL